MKQAFGYTLKPVIVKTSTEFSGFAARESLAQSLSHQTLVITDGSPALCRTYHCQDVHQVVSKTDKSPSFTWSIS